MAEQDEKSEIVQREERVLSWWKENQIFERSLEKTSPNGEFVFYEGPPTANGRPGIHHLESRSFKDAIPRYKTMRGYRVRRKAGWDTHGLPVELEVEKELGFSGKPDIEKYGIAEFNKKCRESVLKYIDEWSRFTDRIGYWVDQEKAYFTFNAPYMESLFSIVKKIYDDGRMYKDYKVLPWCTRCGTALSSHELAQGYADVKDLSVTAKFELVETPGTYFLAWTTTPWTLPGNVALAVGNDITYSYVQAVNGTYIVASDLVEKIFADQEIKIQKEVTGSELVGKEYIALFDFLPKLASETEKPKFKKAYQVYPADFVTTEDGTGIVHTAVMYGTDDFELGNTLGLPKVHAVGADGTFIKGTGYLEGRFVKEEDEKGKPTLAVDIIDDLKKRGMFFSQENHKHTYPFCWRCKTPLIYYARDSWYIRMHDLRDTLTAENKTVHWEPNHIRDGRMGEWLAGAKDWAISRERYWGTPLPIWENEDGSERIVIGSIDELKQRLPKKGNRYFVMRHGESENNVAHRVCSDDSIPSALTEFGLSQSIRAGEHLKSAGITRIISSPLVRARQTAEAVAETLGIPKEQIEIDERIHEVDVGEWSGRPLQEYRDAFESAVEFVSLKPKDGESWEDVRRRVGTFLYEFDAKHENETVLVVTHGTPFRMMVAASNGMTIREYLTDWNVARDPGNAEVKELSFVPLPHNEEYELDLHRPHIDDVVLISDTGTKLRRVKEVMDVWFDSGAMPFAQDHYPFRKKEWIEGPGYPADFISEAIDQTRGWFYTLLAVGVLMGRGTAYRNVICLGHLLDEKGQKMSKSKGNVVNPWEAMDTYGADTLRFWMYYVNQPGDSKSFDEKTVKESARVLSWLDNSAKFYELFKTESRAEGTPEVLDTWMNARVNETVQEMTNALEAYKPYDATRSLSRLIEDVSQWYVRRIRERVRDGDASALATLRSTLHSCALLIAPFSPFIAEDLYGKTRGARDPDSVHLASWPSAGAVDTALIAHMKTVRAVASNALMLRQKSGLKVRQVLATYATTESSDIPEELVTLLKDEINVKKIVFGAETETIDSALTPELIAEGDERELARAVADARKTLGLSPRDTVTIVRGEGPYSVELSTGTLAFDVIRNAS